MTRCAAAALLTLAGCSQIFGLDSPDQAVDAALPTVSGRLYVRYPHHNSTFQVIVDEAELPLARVDVVLSDGRTSQVAVDATGHFSFHTSFDGERYALRIQSPLYPTLELQHDARSIDLVQIRTVRPDAPLAQAGTQITYTTNETYPASSFLDIVSTGQWMSGYTSSSASPYKFDWTQAAAYRDEPTLVSSRAFDRMFVVVMAREPNGGVRADRYRVDDVDMADGANTTISGSTLPVDRNRCVRLELPLATEAARQASAAYTGQALGGWSLYSYPSTDLGVTTGAMIASDGSDASADVAVDHLYGNPFGGQPVVRMYVVRLRPITMPNGTSYLTFGSTYLVPAQLDCQQRTTVVPDVALPSNIMLDGTPLDVDFQKVVVDRNRRLELTWTRRGNGRSHRTYVALFEATDGLPSREVANWITTNGGVRIDPAVLVTGTSYLFSIREQLGYPNAASGDMTPAMPYAEGFMYSNPFVAN
jgi:hypothetical protein